MDRRLGILLGEFSYAVSDKQRFELYAIGAPQRHGQNLYKQNIATYSQELAGDIDGYDTDALQKVTNSKLKLVDCFNQNVAPIDPSYTGKQYWYMYGAKNN